MNDKEYCTLLFGGNTILLLLALSRYFEAYITLILIAMTSLIILNYVNVWKILDEIT